MFLEFHPPRPLGLCAEFSGNLRQQQKSVAQVYQQQYETKFTLKERKRGVQYANRNDWSWTNGREHGAAAS